VETFASLKLEIDNWRWADVPFYLRTGKALAQKSSEITLVSKQVPFNVFRGTEVDLPKRDHLTIRIQPDEGITLAVNAKEPGPDLKLGRVTMDFDYHHAFKSEILDAYELLLLEAMEGDHTLFLREDGVERAWEVLQPVLAKPPPLVTYAQGSWGPEEATKLIHPRHWHVSHEPLPND
jgi:glucose-6-phosphate 1-dehydrogenase